MPRSGWRKSKRRQAESMSRLNQKIIEVQQQLNLTSQNLHTLEENLHEIIKMEDGHLAYFFYKTLPTPRYGWGKSAHIQTEFMIKSDQAIIEEILKSYGGLRDYFSTVKLELKEGDCPKKPYWKNVLLPVIDAVSIVGMIDYYRSKNFVEIGSGNSTRFACDFIEWSCIDCEVTSIDPYPGNTVDAFPHRFIHQPLEDADLNLFKELGEGDIVWLDGSHRCFSNSDVAVFFMDVLPILKPGVIIGVHDIQLPWDYHPSWNKYYFNESQMLAAYLLGARDRLQILMPAFYVNNIAQDLRALLNPIWELFELSKPNELDGGGAFWFTHKKN